MKKLRMILCFVFIFSLCFGGCSTPAQNSSGDSSGKDSSKQEESSRPKENSKTEESPKTENSSKVDVNSKAESSSVSEQSSAAQESYAKEESSKPEESSQSEVSSTPEESSQSADAGWASAYLQIVEDLQAEYGEGRTVIQGDNESFVGLVVVSLIDFDADGQMELFCGYRSADEALSPVAHQKVYGYSGGQVELYFDEPASMKGGANPGSVVRIAGDGFAYIIQYSGQAEDYLMLQNGEFITAHHIDFNSHSWDDIEMTQEQLSSVKSDFWGDSSQPVAVWYISIRLSNGLETLTDTQATIESLRQLAG